MAKPIELPYDVPSRCAARHAWFEALRPMGWAVFLDSGDPARGGGRYDILAAAPRAIAASRRNALTAARRLLHGENGEGSSEWPVCGAAIGYLGYELGRAAAGLPIDKAGTTPFMPESAIALYGWTLVIDHARRRAALTSLTSVEEGDARAVADTILEAAQREPRPFGITGPVRSNLEREEYLPHARRVLDYIDAGDCYQANLTREFSAPFTGDPWTFYRHFTT